MTLTDEQRKSVWGEFMSDISRNNTSIAINKIDLRAAINAADDWVEDNRSSYNQALPPVARSELSALLKDKLLTDVVGKRFEVS